jgi:hypothetical protein
MGNGTPTHLKTCHVSGRDHIELAATAITFNFALSTKSAPDHDLSIHLTSTLSTIFIDKVSILKKLFSFSS